jgi:hypothetical protein
MIFGTDIDLDTCINEGYLIVDFDMRKKLNNDTWIDFYMYYPEYVLKDNPGLDKKKTYNLSLNDLIEAYRENKESIDSFIGDNHNYCKKYCEGKNKLNNLQVILFFASDLILYGLFD